MLADKEQAAQCGPRELILNMLRMAYSFCLHPGHSDPADPSRRVPDQKMIELGNAFLDDVEAIER